jgi:hypothetical protein
MAVHAANRERDGEPGEALPGFELSGLAQPLGFANVPTIQREANVTLLAPPRPGFNVMAIAPRDLVVVGEVFSIRYLSRGEPRIGVFRCSAVDPMVGMRDRATLFLLGEPTGTQARGGFRARIDLEVEATVAGANGRRFRVQVRDASMTGMGIETGQPLAIGDVVDLQLHGGMEPVSYEVVRCDPVKRTSYGLRTRDGAGASTLFASLVRHARDVQARGTHDERRARQNASRQQWAAESKRDAVELAKRRTRKGLPPGMYTRPEPEKKNARPAGTPGAQKPRPKTP